MGALRMTASLLSTRENVHWEIFYYPYGSPVRVDISAGDLLQKPQNTRRNVHCWPITAVYTCVHTVQLYTARTRHTSDKPSSCSSHSSRMRDELWDNLTNGRLRLRAWETDWQTDRRRTPFSEATRSIDLCHLKNIYFENFCCKSSYICF